MVQIGRKNGESLVFVRCFICKYFTYSMSVTVWAYSLIAQLFQVWDSAERLSNISCRWHQHSQLQQLQLYLMKVISDVSYTLIFLEYTWHMATRDVEMPDCCPVLTGYCLQVDTTFFQRPPLTIPALILNDISSL